MRFLFVILFVLLSFSVKSQDSVLREAFKINDASTIGDSKSSVLLALGTPTNESVHINELEGVNELILHYGECSLFFRNNILVSFELKDNSLSLFYNSTEIKVGDNISTLGAIFPNSYNQRDQMEFKTMHIKLMSAFGGGLQQPLDEYVNIQFNGLSSAITEILHGVY